jgi:hypothetical protein
LEELFKKDNVLIILFILKFKINYLSWIFIFYIL